SILKRYPNCHLMLIISAMGKTTNALEQILDMFLKRDLVEMQEAITRLRAYHIDIVNNLYESENTEISKEVSLLFDNFGKSISTRIPGKADLLSYNFEYDQIVSFGELVSSLILCRYLTDHGFGSTLFSAPDLILTDSTFRNGKVDWEATSKNIRQQIGQDYFSGAKKQKVAVTQGFIGNNGKGNITTLGREGSDYSAAIFAYTLGVKELTIWKDVPGVMNADPKWFSNARKLDQLSFRETIELAYYGASVIHPKTIKPLENAEIKLVVKSFINPDEPGTTIENNESAIKTPIYIRKLNQSLVSMSPRDFSFIVEENLSEIFRVFADYQVKVNLMQNSAISFSVCADHHHGLQELVKELQKSYKIRYNDHVELYTIRHYNTEAVKRVLKNKKVLLEQKTRNTIQLVVIPE
ncbi:MAG: aspartate kinase, partial [Bacteroidota bacterium]